MDWLINFLDKLHPDQYLLGYGIIVIGFLAIGVLGAMFCIHFGLRAYWIGLVGLNSVFPDYSLKNSPYSPIYTKKFLDFLPSLNSSITKIDELCSVTFSSAFSIMLVYSNMTIVALTYLFIYKLLENYVPSWILLLPLILLLGFIL